MKLTQLKREVLRKNDRLHVADVRGKLWATNTFWATPLSHPTLNKLVLKYEIDEPGSWRWEGQELVGTTEANPAIESVVPEKLPAQIVSRIELYSYPATIETADGWRRVLTSTGEASTTSAFSAEFFGAFVDSEHQLHQETNLRPLYVCNPFHDRIEAVIMPIRMSNINM